MTTPTHPDGVLRGLGEFDSATIANAIEQFEVRDRAAGYASLELRCQFPEYEPMVGYAVTCTADTTSPGESRPVGLTKLLDAIHAAPKPAVVVVSHVGADRQRSCFAGDMFCGGLHRLGAVGIVTDGGNRDRAGIATRAPGFHVFSPGWVVSHGRGSFLDVNVSVSVCGLNIEPGDLLHGDANGVVSIPHAIADRVAQQAAAVQKYEAAYFEFIESDAFSYKEWRRRIAPSG